MTDEKPDFWKSANAPPWVIGAADQTDMEAGAYLDGVVESYIEAVEETPDLPLTAVALGFYAALKASDTMGLFFMGYVIASAVKKLAEKGKSDG